LDSPAERVAWVNPRELPKNSNRMQLSMEIAAQFDEQNRRIPTGIQRNLLIAQQAES
jgi:hypothetical protein